MDKLIEALRESFAKLGLAEEEIEKAIQEALAKADAPAEENPGEGDPVSPSEEVVEESQGEPAPVVEEVPGDVPPSADPSAVEVPSEVVAEPNAAPEEVVPQEEPAPVPEVPPFDPTELIGKLDEAQKTIEGLLARVQSLEEALKTAGVIDEGDPTKQVGDDLPSAAPTNPTSDVFGDVLKELNSGKKF